MKITCPECKAEFDPGTEDPGPEGLRTTCPVCDGHLVYKKTAEGLTVEKAIEDQPLEAGWDLRPPGAAILREKTKK